MASVLPVASAKLSPPGGRRRRAASRGSGRRSGSPSSARRRCRSGGCAGWAAPPALGLAASAISVSAGSTLAARPSPATARCAGGTRAGACRPPARRGRGARPARGHVGRSRSPSLIPPGRPRATSDPATAREATRTRRAGSGEGGIRTLGTTLHPSHDFQSCPFNHSGTSPGRRGSLARPRRPQTCQAPWRSTGTAAPPASAGRRRRPRPPIMKSMWIAERLRRSRSSSDAVNS